MMFTKIPSKTNADGTAIKNPAAKNFLGFAIEDIFGRRQLAIGLKATTVAHIAAEEES